MDAVDFEDRLEPVGILGGLFLVVVALGTLLELPWTTTEFTTVAIAQTVGILLTIALGLVLMGLAYSGDVGDLLER